MISIFMITAILLFSKYYQLVPEVNHGLNQVRVVNNVNIIVLHVNIHNIIQQK